MGDTVDDIKAKLERDIRNAERTEIEELRKRQSELAEKAEEQRLKVEVFGGSKSEANKSKNSTAKKQSKLLLGAVKRKGDKNEEESLKKSKESSEQNGQKKAENSEKKETAEKPKNSLLSLGDYGSSSDE